MSLRRGKWSGVLPRRLLTGALLALVLMTPAHAALLPAGFFDMQATPGAGPAAVEADRMAYDAQTKVISADGSVIMHYQGYAIRADRLTYNQATGEMQAIGNVTLRDPLGSVFQMDSVEVTGGFKEAIIQSMTLTTEKGAVITARDAHYSSELISVLTDAAYSPCGLCEDSKGRKIGWRVKAARITYDRANASVYLEQPTLELLGMPVAWLPWFWTHDPSQPRAAGMRLPTLDYDQKRGAVVALPFFVPVGEDVDITFTPELMSNQGALMKGDVTWRLPGLGSVDIAASGIYQLNPSAFSGVGNRDWRGAIQTAGAFTPLAHWQMGWSYTAFTDNAYLTDYKLTTDTSSVNQVYATYLDDLTWFDIRAQSFNRLGDYTTNDPAQGATLPVTSFETTTELQPGWGRLHLTGKLLSVVREAEQSDLINGTPFVFGEKGEKQHLMLEGAWEDQLIAPGGVAFTPYLGGRLDLAHYDDNAGTSDILLGATPIAALDMRWPLVASNGPDTHIFEPIAQLVYRGSTTTETGLTNDDAHSFVFDTSNLFSYNRFSGIDRQETGLRANIGGHYLANFADGSWLDFVAGQSFHLAGANAFTTTDAVNTAVDGGLSDSASFIVAGLSGGWGNGLTAAGKVQIDPAGLSVTRFGAGASYAAPDGWTVAGSYIYIAPNTGDGTVDAQHEARGDVGVPVFDYWRLTAGLTWDIDNATWVEARGGLAYDDGYLNVTTYGTITPGSWSTGIHLALKGPDGEVAF